MSDINFVNVDAQQITSELINDFETYTGDILYAGDARRIFLQGFAYVFVNLLNSINTTGRSNLLRYAFDETLDALGELYGTPRNKPQYATVTIRFTLSAAQSNDIQIPAGTRVTPDGILFYATNSILTIPAGSTYGDITATCLSAGILGNGFTSGQINKLVDGNSYVSSVANNTTSSGGADLESNDDYRERLRNAPYSFSTAGPTQAYYYWAKNASIDVEDVSITSPNPGAITIYVLKTGGVIPGSSDSVLTAVANACSDKNRRPLTDNVSAVPVNAKNTTISVEYYISNDNSANATFIQTAVNSAIDDYKTWQTTKIGRTINPDELRKRILDAGASRVDVTAPVRTVVATNECAQITSVTATYKGLGD